MSDERYCPRLSDYNLHYIRHGQAHLTVQGLHHSTHVIRNHPWFLFTDLFDGTRTCKTLLKEVKDHVCYRESALAQKNEAEQKNSLASGLLLFKQQGFILA